MKTLVVLLLAGLCCGAAEASRVSSCDLYWMLRTYVGNVNVTTDHSVLRGDVVLAQILCHVTNTTNFDDRAVTQTVVERDEHHSAEHGLHNRPHGRWRRHDRRPSKARPKPPSHQPRPDDSDKDVWTLYGIYQLGNRLVCDDGVTPSLNICNIDCSQLVNGDLLIATQCLVKVLNYREPDCGRHSNNELKTMIELLFKDQCSFELSYFHCSLP